MCHDLGVVSLVVREECSDGRAVISIEDQGVGIAPENQAMLFTLFLRIKTDETANIDGSGLGLYLVKELVGVMDGEVWFENRPGSGSTFSFRLTTAVSMDPPGMDDQTGQAAGIAEDDRDAVLADA